MAFVDEQITLLERENRRMKAEEAAKSAQKEAKPLAEGQNREKPGEGMTLEEMLAAVRDGEITLPGLGHFTFETRRYFTDQVPMVLIHSFYTGVQEADNAAVFVNHDYNVSQILTLADEDMRNTGLPELKKRLEEGMQSAGAYAEVVREESAGCTDYLIYRTPTKKGWLYNLVFSLRQGSGRVVGNYNCMETDRETWGLLLEALILRLQELAGSIQEEKDDKECGNL